MPRTRRYIFNTLTVVSVLLLLGTVGLWVNDVRHVSVWLITTVPPQDSESMLVMHNSPGELFIGVIPNYLLEASDGIDTAVHASLQGGWFGFGWSWNNSVYGGRSWGIMLPHWFHLLIFAILPTFWLYKWNKRRKLGSNACPSCGYDLTGNETGVCPECGVNLRTLRQVCDEP